MITPDASCMGYLRKSTEICSNCKKEDVRSATVSQGWPTRGGRGPFCLLTMITRPVELEDFCVIGAMLGLGTYKTTQKDFVRP